MRTSRGIAAVALALCLGWTSGCDSSSDSSGGGGSNYAGTWSGTVCGRPMTMTLFQDGTTLTGNYTLSNPAFGEGLRGTVSSLTPPATVTLRSTSGRNFLYELTFNSYRSFSGGYYKDGVKVCDVNGSK
jgi:hypothetical protein